MNKNKKYYLARIKRTLTKLNKPSPISLTVSGGGKIIIKWTDTNS